MTARQLSLFDAPAAAKIGQTGMTVALYYPVETAPPATDQTLGAAVNRFLAAKTRAGWSKHTVDAYKNDLRLLTRFISPDQTVEDISVTILTDFLGWLQTERDAPCSPKTLERRITALRSFFRWLAEVGTIRRNPARSLNYLPATVTFPPVPSQRDIERALDAAGEMMAAKGDPRPLLLLKLVTTTGLKKGELMRLKPDDIDRASIPPAVVVRYTSPRYFWKSRRLPLPTDILPLLDAYRDDYPAIETAGVWFPFAERTLENIIAAVGWAAGLPKKQRLNFEELRRYYAVRQCRAGMNPDTLRERLGLSPQAWPETWRKIRVMSRLSN